ncbi:DUF4876 domain-containing protein [Chryseobacterium sp. MYb328]|uniref:DUF4876 domain-containing protein n=1 Tax=Chryseobacterium sp. MYb328 TaxID=2745231 RepID=UPI0030AB6394
MKKRFLLLSFVAMMGTAFTVTSCTDDEFGVQAAGQNGVLTLSFTGENISIYEKLDIEAIEVNTGATTKRTSQNANVISLELPHGSYKITVNGKVVNNQLQTIDVAGTANADVVTLINDVKIPLFFKTFHEDFIIEEIFFTGIKTPDGKNYNSSRYFKIVNNTNKVLYADNLIIANSRFMTTEDDNPTPYDVTKYFPVKGVLILPTDPEGKIKKYPVKPGDFIVVADNAINHKAQTSTAFDLHNADFEFPSSVPALGQVDNPDVPNADLAYTAANNMFTIHNRGFESFVIARFPAGETKNTFLQKNKYDYSYISSAGTVMTRNAYSIPNSWIIDGVNNSVPTKFVHLLTSPSIDAGWTSVGSIDSDPNRFGKTVRRKIIGTMGANSNLYMDTNNSSNDFIRDSEASLKNGIVHPK